MWVLFNDLQDDANHSKCDQHVDGPQTMKYCGDGGVYYAYNYIEDGDLVGHVDYPWGADRLGERDIDPKVRFPPSFIGV